ncbi:MAG: beta-lactamase family protein, partial [Chloroflexi bacterium]|nr:beta-lactamase family protein [Chloroflexota bacterium]
GVPQREAIEDPVAALAVILRAGRELGLDAVRQFALPARRTEEADGRLWEIDGRRRRIGAIDLAGGLHTLVTEAGDFRLDDPVQKYLPEFAAVQVVGAPGAALRPPVRPITVEDLLLHTSGLSHRTSELYRTLGVRSREDTLTTFVTKITKAPLMEDPHTRFRYSEGTTVLGRLVEIWSGQPFDTFLEQRVFRPLGMTDTVFVVGPDRRDRLVTVYGPAPGGGLAPVAMEAVPFTTRPRLLEGAVGLVSSVPDFLRFSQMLLGRGTLGGIRLLPADTVARMTANGLPVDVLAARGGRMGWGLGNVDVRMAASDPGANRGEFGWDGTGGTIFWVDPTTETVVLLMTQSVPANPDGIRQKFKAIVQRAVR